VARLAILDIKLSFFSVISFGPNSLRRASAFFEVNPSIMESIEQSFTQFYPLCTINLLMVPFLRKLLNIVRSKYFTIAVIAFSFFFLFFILVNRLVRPKESTIVKQNEPKNLLSEEVIDNAVRNSTVNEPISTDVFSKVVRVIDGDTVEIEGGRRVRYIGIDTPEIVDPSSPAECYGKEASDKNKGLVEGKEVRLEKDVSNTDRYGRLLRYVYVGDVFVNNYLVQEGFAHSSSYPPDIKYQDVLKRSEEEARKLNKGLWGKCGTGSSVEGMSAEFVDSSRDSLSVNNGLNYEDSSSNENVESSSPPGSDEGCTIKGNISSSGEKIYHVLGCPNYASTRIDTDAGERCFRTEEEALAAGWRIAKNCPK